jgi:hypothetical protein
MEKSKTTPTQFIESLPEDKKSEIKILDEMITKIMPNNSEKVLWTGKFWGGSDQKIIGYGDYSYVRTGNKKVDWFKVGLAMQKNYITVFVNAVEDREYVAEKYGKDLGKAKIGKSSISFKSLEDIDLEKLKEIVKKGFGD